MKILMVIFLLILYRYSIGKGENMIYTQSKVKSIQNWIDRVEIRTGSREYIVVGEQPDISGGYRTSSHCELPCAKASWLPA